MPDPIVVFWRSLEEPGMERATLQQTDDGWRMLGTVLIALPDAIEVRYLIEADSEWRTPRVHVDIDHAWKRDSLDLHITDAGDWILNGRPLDLGSDVLDVDLGITPITNTLAIRRLGLAVGEARDIAVEWVLFPSLEVVRGEQRYERLDDHTYRFTTGDFTADIQVDSHGLVVRYGTAWERVET